MKLVTRVCFALYRCHLQRVFIVALAVLHLELAAQQPALKQITLEDVFQRGTFRPKYTGDIRWMNNDNYYSDMVGGALVRFSIIAPQSKAKTPATVQLPDTLIRPAEFKHPQTNKSLDIEEYIFSKEEKKVLLLTDRTAIYRHSATYVCYVFDIATRKIALVFEGKPISNPTISPDGNKIGFTYANNLYYTDLATNTTFQVTTDGSKNAIINGSTDWVYEEEFGFPEGFYWNNASDKLAFYRFDESAVRLFTMDVYGQLYPERNEFKYPKAGEKNADVSIHIYDLATKKTVPVDIGPEKEQYIPRIRWAAQPNTLTVLRLNRHQNKLDILWADGSKGSTKLAYTESSDTYVDIEEQTLTFLKNAAQYILLSERDGHAHLYLYENSGKLIRQLTSGAWDVSAFYGIDEKTQTLYYQSTEDSPLERHIYSIKSNGAQKTRLSRAEGYHRASFSSSYTYFIDRVSSAVTPEVVTLCSAVSGAIVRTLEDNKALRNKLAEYAIQYKRFFQFSTAEVTRLNGWMIKPHGFDSTRKYPVLMFVYGGPGSQQVTDAFSSRDLFWYQTLAAQGYIIACVDGRGTGGRGTHFKKCTYMDLGNLETQDQIAAARYFATLPFVDTSRIGIWGWSYGGYMSSLCMTKGADVFKMGIAVAPVTNWRFYDTIYTERYLRTPQENAKGYDENSPINFTNLLKGKYLLIHGTGDDNVHYQNSLEMVNALVRSNKQFDSFFYPNRSHSISGGNTSMHLYQKLTDFILKNL